MIVHTQFVPQNLKIMHRPVRIPSCMSVLVTEMNYSVTVLPQSHGYSGSQITTPLTSKNTRGQHESDCKACQKDQTLSLTFGGVHPGP